jgi:hypothetical protein
MTSFTSRSSRRRFALAVLPAALWAVSAGASATSWCAERCDRAVTDWNALAHQVIVADEGYQNPMAASRSLAMMHLAMHDAVNTVEPRYASFAKAAPAAAQGADATVAAIVAAHDVLLALYPKQQPLLDAQLQVALRDAGIGNAVTQGRRVGAAAAAAVVAQRAADGSQVAEPWQPASGPGAYQYVPGTNFLAAPHWRAVTPFALQSASQLRVAPPPALHSARYAADFDEVKRTGAKDAGAQRSTDQTRYAAFWYEFSEAGWNRIARTVAQQQPQNLWDRARIFALLNAAMADAYIAGWDSKLHYDLWRPVTAIRAAADDGNAATQPDAQWESMLPTPPIQDYPSTHSALGAAAAQVLAHGFGRDRIRFEFASPTALPEQPTRRFASFSAAARENADSRVRAGLHFRFATTQGLALGERIGHIAVRSLLAPLD